MLEFELAADRAAVDLLDQPIIFQLVEIAPNGFLRNTEFIRQLIHVNPAVGPDQRQYFIAPIHGIRDIHSHYTRCLK